MFSLIRSTVLAAVTALAIVGFGSAPSDAAPVNLGGNVYTGDLAGANLLGAIDLDAGAFVFSGVTGAAAGGLNVTSFFSSSSVPSATGAIQILIQAGAAATINIASLTWNGIAIALAPVTGGFAGIINGALPGVFDFQFTNANIADSVQISVSVVPLPPAALLLLGALGGLGYLSRRRNKEAVNNIA